MIATSWSGTVIKLLCFLYYDLIFASVNYVLELNICFRSVARQQFDTTLIIKDYIQEIENLK